MNDIKKIFKKYASAVEQTNLDDNWNRLEEYFAEDAIYVTGRGVESTGRRGVIDYIHHTFDVMDRRFDSREFTILGEPAVNSNELVFTWLAKYKKEGYPDLVVKGGEKAVFTGSEISRLEDTYDEENLAVIQSWVSEHGHIFN